jgi:hypothetical protein
VPVFRVRRPPLGVVLVAVLLIALAETGGAALSLLRSPIQDYARARIAASPSTHGLTGAAEYDAEITGRTIFSAEAGLSFFHTHGEGMGVVLLFAGTVVASVVPRRSIRGLLHALLTAGALFPLGYLVYAALVLEAGRETGVDIAERYALTPLGSLAIAGLVGLALMLVLALRRPRAT